LCYATSIVIAPIITFVALFVFTDFKRRVLQYSSVSWFIKELTDFLYGTTLITTPFVLVVFTYFFLTRALVHSVNRIVNTIHYLAISATIASLTLITTIWLVGHNFKPKDFIEMILVASPAGAVCGIIMYLLWRREYSQINS
jgi:hypothetical protein